MISVEYILQSEEIKYVFFSLKKQYVLNMKLKQSAGDFDLDHEGLFFMRLGLNANETLLVI
jgi:hypothetical protein